MLLVSEGLKSCGFVQICKSIFVYKWTVMMWEVLVRGELLKFLAWVVIDDLVLFVYYVKVIIDIVNIL